MPGHCITGLKPGWWYDMFAGVIALLLPAATVLLGACWLVMKTDGALQRRARDRARIAWPLVVRGMG
jgi:cytochrome d ubiquinol oxidase subunit II